MLCSLFPRSSSAENDPGRAPYLPLHHHTQADLGGRPMRYLTSAIVLSLLLLQDTACADAGDVVTGSDSIYDRSQAEYANAWWQWAVSMPEKDSPIKDRVGVNCDVNQEGPVWFLAGGFGTSRIHRKCRIPADRYLFFPVINMLYFPNGADASPTCDSVKESASLNNQYLRSFKVVVDDRKYVNPAVFRHGSQQCFDLIARKPGIYHPETVYPSATDGYWVMLKPLAPGRHNIAFSAEYNRPDSAYGRMSQDIEYSIEVDAKQ